MGIHTAAVQQLYVAYFSRPADAAGLIYWENIVEAANGDTAAVSAAFAGSDEYIETYAGMSAYERVDTIYMNLFGRHAEPGGLKFWGQALITGASTIDAIVTTVAEAAQGEDKVVYANKVTAATAFSDALDTSEEMINYSGPDANAAAKIFLSTITTDESVTAAIDPAALDAAVLAVVNEGRPDPVVVVKNLTKGIDTMVGGAGDDIFTAVDTEWSSLDKVDGGAGNNTFTVASSLAIPNAPAGATVANIGTMNVISGSNISLNATTYDVDTLNITAGGTSLVSAGATTDVNELASTNQANITGGNNVTVVHSGTSDVRVTDSVGKVDITSNTVDGSVYVTDATGDVTIAAKGNVSADGATLAVTRTGAVSHADQIAHFNAASAASDAADAAGQAASDAADVVTDIAALKATVNGSSTFQTTFDATLTAHNNGEITRDQKIAIDAAFAAGLKTDAATAQAAAVALVTPIATAAAAAKAVADLAVLSTDAAFNAALTMISTDFATGSGNVETNGLGSTTLKSAKITGNFNGTVTLKDATVLHNTLTTVSLDNAGAADLTGDALTNVSITNSGNGATIRNATAGHTQNLTISGLSGGTISDTTAAMLNIVSNGTVVNDVSLTAGAATALKLTGTAGLNTHLTGLSSDAVITATGSSGANTVTIGAGQSYLGGSGTDSVTVNGGTQTAAVSGGAGTADKLVISVGTNLAGNGTTTGAAAFSGFEILEVAGGTTNLADFTNNSTFTSIVTQGNWFMPPAVVINGLNATQAGNVTVTGNSSLTLGLTGATTVGQLDTVHITTAGSTNGAITLSSLGLAGVETLNLTVNVEPLTISSLAAATALTAINIDGTESVELTTGALALNVNTVIDAHGIKGDVTIDASSANGNANGLRIIGSLTGKNDIQGNDGASVIVGGNAGDVLIGGAAADDISSGNGNNLIDADHGNNKVTVGDGFNTITSGSGNDTIKVGSGGNVIWSGLGADKITLAAHVAGVVNYISLDGTGSANMETITGFISGQDKLQLITGSMFGALELLATTTVGTMRAGVTHSATVADTAAVYSALIADLDNSAGHEFAVSSDAPGGLVARTVTFTTGAAAGTYLVINDNVLGFQAGNDLVVKLVGTTSVVANDFMTTTVLL
jgi:hypothetical protein